MRPRVSHLLLLVLAASVALAIHRSLWGPVHFKAKVVFGYYLICLVSATVAAFHAPPGWRRPWLGYAAFGWAWLLTGLRDYLGRIPDIYASNMMAYSLLGMAMGVICAIVCHVLPGMRKGSISDSPTDRQRDEP